jgi:hypothetical protein
MDNNRWITEKVIHNWQVIDGTNPDPKDYICGDCKIYGRVRVGGIMAWRSSLSCEEIRKKLESHQLNKYWYCEVCELKMARAPGRQEYYWWDEVLDCDEVIIKGIIE